MVPQIASVLLRQRFSDCHLSYVCAKYFCFVFSLYTVNQFEGVADPTAFPGTPLLYASKDL